MKFAIEYVTILHAFWASPLLNTNIKQVGATAQGMYYIHLVISLSFNSVNNRVSHSTSNGMYTVND